LAKDIKRGTNGRGKNTYRGPGRLDGGVKSAEAHGIRGGNYCERGQKAADRTKGGEAE